MKATRYVSFLVFICALIFAGMTILLADPPGWTCFTGAGGGYVCTWEHQDHASKPCGAAPYLTPNTQGYSCRNLCNDTGMVSFFCMVETGEHAYLGHNAGSCECAPPMSCEDQCGGSPQCLCGCQGGQWSDDAQECISPILVNLKNNSPEYHLTSASDGVVFDLDADGSPEQVAWTQPGFEVAFLTLDRNGNGQVDDGSELFGTATRKQDGSVADNGFDALLDLDGGPGVSDGKITAGDSYYRTLRLWVDQNHNGESEVNELFTLTEANLTTIFTEYWAAKRQDRNGNWYALAGIASHRKDNREEPRRVFDVYLRVIRD